MSEKVECPYCEESVELDECHDIFDMECPYCYEMFEVRAEYTVDYYTDKIIYENCRGCGERFRFESSSYPIPNKFRHLESDDYIICDKCYRREILNDLKLKGV